MAVATKEIDEVEVLPACTIDGVDGRLVGGPMGSHTGSAHVDAQALGPRRRGKRAARQGER